MHVIIILIIRQSSCFRFGWYLPRSNIHDLAAVSLPTKLLHYLKFETKIITIKKKEKKPRLKTNITSK